MPTFNAPFARWANNDGSVTLPPQFSYARESKAYTTDHKGRMKLLDSGVARAPFDPITGENKGLLIEESRTNLLTYSEDFDNAAWIKSNSSISANAITAPDGTLTAAIYVNNGPSGGLSANGVSYSAGSYYTVSIYVKNKSGNSATQYITLFFWSTVAGTYQGAIFNPSTGTFTYTSAGITSSSIEVVNEGWYRISATILAASTLTTSYQYRIGGSPTDIYQNNTQNGTDALYIWGAQLEAGAFPTSYIPSTQTFTSRASTATYYDSTGTLQTAGVNEARLNYNPADLTAPPKLLLEDSRTNLLTYSEQFDNTAWAKTAVSVSANATTAPDGTTTADKLVETTDPTAHTIYRAVGISFTAGNKYTYSFYVKQAERNVAAIAIDGGPFGGTSQKIAFNISTQTIFGVIGTSSYGYENCGNGWFRIWLTTVEATTTATAGVRFYVRESNNVEVYTGDGTSGIYIWGAQLEAGSYPTSYIPTTTAAVTRAADLSSSAASTRVADQTSVTGTNFSDWYNQSEGTFVVDYAYLTATPDDYSEIFNVSDGTTNNRIMLRKPNYSGNQIYVATSGVAQVDMADTFQQSTIAALGYKDNDVIYTYTGDASALTDTSCTIPTVTKINIGSNYASAGSINGHIKSLAYYPKRLTNTELQALTS